MTDRRDRSTLLRAGGAVLAAALLFTAESADAFEPWVVPEVARTCPHYGPGYVEVPGSRTCVRISGRVVTDYTVGAKNTPERRGDLPREFGTGARVTVESRTETDIGPLHLIYRMDAGRSRISGR
ncbi:porin [Enterovirga sp. CN4-39]|uniref:porin n=1 Tax=Enterovirga sp. CN4-39 TaxID=3400910 RepID=UPI003BFBA388